jgi:hypothetical protein
VSSLTIAGVPGNASGGADLDARDNPLLEAALAYAARGWPVVRLLPRQKYPTTKDWQHAATTDRRYIETLWAFDPNGNVGVQLGQRSGIIDVECDSPEAERELGLLLGENAVVVPTFTGKRGKHRLFRYTADLPRQRKTVFKYRGVEFRTGCGGKGAQSVFPPSVHPDGPTYRWLVHPDESELLPFPAAALAIVRRELDAEDARQASAASGEDAIAEGKRNDRLTRAAGAMRRHGFNENEVRAALLATNARRCQPPLDATEIAGIARSICQYEAGSPELFTVIHTGSLSGSQNPARRRNVARFTVEV